MSDTTLTKSKPKAMTREDHQPQTNFRRPWYHIESDKESYILYVALPGVSKDGVNVALDGDQLTITGQRKSQVPETWQPVFSELNAWDFRLALRLNIKVDESKISGEVQDGLLKLVLPMTAEAKPRLIKID